MLFAIFTFALFASAITANKIIFYTMSPPLLVGIRMLTGGLILLIYTIFNVKNKLNVNILKNNLYTLSIITLCTNFLPALLKAYSLKNMVSSNMAFFGALDPFITAIFAYFLLGEKLSLQKIIGIILGFAGSLILIMDQINLNCLLITLPEISIILSISISRFGWMQAQGLLKSNKINPIQLNAITMIPSGILSLIMAIIFKQTTVGCLADYNLEIFNYKIFRYLISSIGFNGLLLFFISYTIIVGNVIAYNFYGYLLKKYSPVYISLLSFSIPIFVYVYGILFLNEKLTAKFIMACIITFIGLIIFVKDEKRSSINYS